MIRGRELYNVELVPINVSEARGTDEPSEIQALGEERVR